jgi:hypothetical protein
MSNGHSAHLLRRKLSTLWNAAARAPRLIHLALDSAPTHGEPPSANRHLLALAHAATGKFAARHCACEVDCRAADKWWVAYRTEISQRHFTICLRAAQGAVGLGGAGVPAPLRSNIGRRCPCAPCVDLRQDPAQWPAACQLTMLLYSPSCLLFSVLLLKAHFLVWSLEQVDLRGALSTFQGGEAVAALAASAPALLALAVGGFVVSQDSVSSSDWLAVLGQRCQRLRALALEDMMGSAGLSAGLTRFAAARREPLRVCIVAMRGVEPKSASGAGERKGFAGTSTDGAADQDSREQDDADQHFWEHGSDTTRAWGQVLGVGTGSRSREAEVCGGGCAALSLVNVPVRFLLVPGTLTSLQLVIPQTCVSRANCYRPTAIA